MKKPYAIIIMDGYGLNPKHEGNAVYADGSKNVTELEKEYPSSTLGASGMSVGLPDGQMGNSEVGHLNIGAGRIVYQDLTKITKEIRDGEFFRNKELLRVMDYVKANGKKLHLWGLVSTGGVHSHTEHLYALVEMAKKEGLENVYIHAFTDGRDVPPTSGAEFLRELQAKLNELNFGVIASVSGRYYAMDRDNNWDREEKAYEALTEGKAHTFEGSAEEAIEKSYADGVTDEFVVPVTLTKNGKPVALVEKGDGIVCFNFRPDRAREITRAFVDPGFDGFARKKAPQDLVYVCMTQYDASMPNVEIAFPPQTIKNTLGEYLSANGLHQLRIAETEKYAHVTFFFNGGVETANPLEDRILIPSPKVATYDLKPEMSAFEVTDKVIEEIGTGVYDAIILNFANADMVGHTGVFEAAVKAIEALDLCVQKVTDAVLAVGGQILLTADHGNADCMLDAGGNVVTAHSTNPVPLVHISASPCSFREDTAETAKLADIAPTMLKLMELPIPPEMSGDCLVKIE